MTLATRYLTALALGIIGLFALVSVASADHAWGPYHWARSANPFTLQLGDNVTSSWDSYLQTASADWSASSMLDTQVAAGKGGSNCRANTGRAEICNAKYGRNGWLGIAQIWVSGEHITKGVVKMNDTYFNTATYNKPAWRALVMCQEIGHIFGLDHQDENFSNTPLGTCMDYTSDPSPNQHPNAHDYEMLETIYAHLDAAAPVKQNSFNFGFGRSSLTVPSISLDLNVELSDDPATWGEEIRRSVDGRASLFVQNLGNGQKIFRHVFWAEPRGAGQK